MNVFVLMHSSGDRYEVDNIKVEGVYASMAGAEARLQTLPAEEVVVGSIKTGVRQLLSADGNHFDAWWTEEHQVTQQ